MRRWPFLCQSQRAGATLTPYQVVLQAVAQEGRGLLAAAEVFRRFQRFYNDRLVAVRSCTSNATAAAATSASSHTSGDFAPTAVAQRLTLGKPLTDFCGRVEDVEPMTVVLLKVLCDLQRLEEMRFLFTQCLLELGDRSPSVELLNVYLLAISLTDTFNQYEVENIAELLQAKGIVPDIVTKLSMLLLYLRLDYRDCIASWWIIEAEVRDIIASQQLAQYPLLPLRLQHCFQTLLRVHYDTAVIQSCFELLRCVAPERITRTLVLPYLLLGVLNLATPPSAVVAALQAAEETAHGAEGESVAAENDCPVDSGPISSSGSSTSRETYSGSTISAGPLLSSGFTVLRLMAKCARWGDAVSASSVLAYVAKFRDTSILENEEQQAMASLLFVAAAVKAGDLRTALSTVERLPAPYHSPGARPKLFLQSRRVTLLPTDPITGLVMALTPVVKKYVTMEGGMEQLVRELRHPESESELPVPVSTITLNLLIAASRFLDSPRHAESILKLYDHYGAIPSPETYATLVRVYEEVSPSSGIARLPSLRREMSDVGAVANYAFLHSSLAMALNAHDVGMALQVLEELGEGGGQLDVKYGSRLLKELAAVVDDEGMRCALELMWRYKWSIDARSQSLCAASLQRWGLPTDVLQPKSAVAS